MLWVTIKVIFVCFVCILYDSLFCFASDFVFFFVCAGNAGHAGTCGCCFCTRPKSLKHVNSWQVTNPSIHERLGQLRTGKLNKTVLAKMEKKVITELTQNTAKYAKDNPDFDLQRWLKPNQLHLTDHPAHTFISDYSRDHGYNYLALQIFEKLPDSNFIFDRATPPQ